MKKKKINIDQSYSNSDTNVEFNTDRVVDEVNSIRDIDSDEVYDDLDFWDQYEEKSDEDDEYIGQ